MGRERKRRFNHIHGIRLEHHLQKARDACEELFFVAPASHRPVVESILVNITQAQWKIVEGDCKPEIPPNPDAET